MSGRPCSICSHPARARIERALGDGAALRRVERYFGTSPQALIRHRARTCRQPRTLTLHRYRRPLNWLYLGD
jgi:hypothetical protein